MNINTTTITITFGDQADNNIGMQKYEKCKHVSAGLSIEDLKIAENKFKQSGCECNYVDLAQMLPGEIKINDKIYDIPNAAILIIRNGINKILEEKENGVNKYTHEDLFNEHIALDYDKKAHMYGRIVNKTARWNLSFDDEDREPDYENKMGRIVAYKNVALTSKIRDELPNWFGDKAIGLVAEANLYYDVVSPHKGGDRGKSYIGYHGDTERNITIGIRNGATLPLYYQWYLNTEQVGNPIELILNGGDIYAMSHNATGYNWKKQNILTLRHAASNNKKLIGLPLGKAISRLVVDEIGL